jgi:acetyl esterase
VPIHPRILEQIDFERKHLPELEKVSPAKGREAIRELARLTDSLADPPPRMARTEDTFVPLPDHRVGVRVYIPRTEVRPVPVVMYFHGGAWIWGDLETHDSVCREIAQRSASALIAVDYRRSPEHRFPEALEDCYAATAWAASPSVAERWGWDPTRIAVAGDSAGGNMAAVVSFLARDRGTPSLAGQVLICPVVGYYPDTPSYRENATGCGLDASSMPSMWGQYLRSSEDGKDPRVAPLLLPDFSRLPPALIVTAEYDILRDEGERFGERLRLAGVPTQVTRYSGMVHGFIDYRGIAESGEQALDEISMWLTRQFAR